MNRIGLVLLVVLLLGATVGAIGFYLWGPGAMEPLEVLEVSGGVEHARGGQRGQAQVGMRLMAGDELRTDLSGSAVIARGRRAPIRLEGATSVRIESVSEDLVEVRLRRGRLHARVRPDAGALRVLEGHRSVIATDAVLRVASDGERGLVVEPERGDVAVVGVPGAGRVQAGQRLIDREGGSRVVPLSAKPLLDVRWPERTREREVVVTGDAEPGSRLMVRVGAKEFSADVGLDGRFEVRVDLPTGEHDADVELVDPMGRTRRRQGVLVRQAGDRPTFSLDVDYGER